MSYIYFITYKLPNDTRFWVHNVLLHSYVFVLIMLTSNVDVLCNSRTRVICPGRGVTQSKVCQRENWSSSEINYSTARRIFVYTDVNVDDNAFIVLFVLFVPSLMTLFYTLLSAYFRNVFFLYFLCYHNLIVHVVADFNFYTLDILQVLKFQKNCI